MSDLHEKVKLHQKDFFDRNKKIDQKTVNAHKKLELELMNLGVETKSKFNIEPPLGGERTRLYSGNF